PAQKDATAARLAAPQPEHALVVHEDVDPREPAPARGVCLEGELAPVDTAAARRHAAVALRAAREVERQRLPPVDRDLPRLEHLVRPADLARERPLLGLARLQLER